jgi:hypothetical protein
MYSDISRLTFAGFCRELGYAREHGWPEIASATNMMATSHHFPASSCSGWIRLRHKQERLHCVRSNKGGADLVFWALVHV